ncbi:MAG: hypothetical protein OSJ70_05475 [Bacilli bacterium]|nr:hypothetical protein [Bacilli bacterium]
MIKGVETFTNYLEEEKKKIAKRSIRFMTIDKDIANTQVVDLPKKITDREMEINFILQRITMSDEEYLKHMEIFYHFKDLSRYIEEANLSCREVFNLVTYMLRRNIKCIDRARATKAINDTELRKYQFENISAQEIDMLVSTGEINRIINGDDKELSAREILIRDAILDNSDKFFSDIKDLIDEHKAIKTHYFSKMAEYDEEDIEIIIANLQALSFSNNVCEMIRYILDKQLTSRKKSSTPLTSSEPKYSCPASKVEEITIPYKEQKDIYNYIREYFNIPKKEITKPVDYNKMLEIVSLMLKINIDLKTIRAYIRQITSELKKNADPASKYQTFKSKLAYYLSEGQIAYLDELYEAFEADNSLWMEEFVSYLEEVMNYVSETDTYQYELETAKQLMKVENGK